ncbi:MAG: TrmH family RNA methyltransferase [Myxococcota bacterium]
MAELVVVLVRTSGPVNLGLCARVCANLGVDSLRLVAPECEVDQPDARKFANHAKEALLRAPRFETLADAVRDCDFVAGTSAHRRQRGFIAPLGPGELARTVQDFSRAAIVFGNEADGLGNSELRQCQATVHLPTFGDYSSFNLSHAVAVTLFALRTSERVSGAISKRPLQEMKPRNDAEAKATQSELGELCSAWLSTLERSGYFRLTDRDRFAPKLRAMLGRFAPAKHDAGLLRGMLAHFDKRLQDNHDA